MDATDFILTRLHYLMCDGREEQDEYDGLILLRCKRIYEHYNLLTF